MMQRVVDRLCWCSSQSVAANRPSGEVYKRAARGGGGVCIRRFVVVCLVTEAPLSLMVCRVSWAYGVRVSGAPAQWRLQCAGLAAPTQNESIPNTALATQQREQPAHVMVKSALQYPAHISSAASTGGTFDRRQLAQRGPRGAVRAVQAGARGRWRSFSGLCPGELRAGPCQAGGQETAR